MKIGFAGNVNNYPFMIARAMRQLGHEVLFIVDEPERLHRPEYRYADISYPYPDWIHELILYPGSRYALPGRQRRRMVELLQGCDAVVLNYLAVSLLPEVARPGVAILTGTDLEVYANYQTLANGLAVDRRPAFFWSALKRLLYRLLIPRERAGIQAAVGVNYLAKGLFPRGDALLAELGVPDDKRITFMMSDLDSIELLPPPRNPVPRLFHASRLNWVRPLPPGYVEMDYKGSDVLIRGLALFWQQGGPPLQVRIVKKGLHVAATLALADELGIGGRIEWLDEMSQAQVAAEIRQADVVVEQLGQAVVGMIGLDALAAGRPVIANCRPEIFEPLLGERSPVCQATSPEQVRDQLQRLLDPAERERVGLASHDYACRYFSPARAARLCLDKLQPHVH